MTRFLFLPLLLVFAFVFSPVSLAGASDEGFPGGLPGLVKERMEKLKEERAEKQRKLKEERAKRREWQKTHCSGYERNRLLKCTVFLKDAAERQEYLGDMSVWELDSFIKNIQSCDKFINRLVSKGNYDFCVSEMLQKR